MRLVCLLMTVCALAMPGAALALPAFPGAEGFGAESMGGRGGALIKVTNLDDAGPGSFRAAATASGARYVVFAVSGVINLASDVDIYQPFITIAGETSPGGILITGRRVKINTQHVIIRHMRFRVGSHRVADGADPESLDALNIWGRHWGPNEAHDIIIDHCSVSWGIDENLSITGGVTKATVQWSIISEGLNDAGHPKPAHSKGLLISGKYNYPNTVSVHHNYLAHNADRNPMISTPDDVSTTVDLVNNVSYNWKGGLAPLGVGLVHLNGVHNYARPGPNSHAYSFEVTHDPSTEAARVLYVHGNLGSTRLSQAEEHWHVGVHWRNEALSTAWRRDTPWAAPAVTTTSMSDEYAKTILGDVGATRPVRDAVDVRVVGDFLAGTGATVPNVAFPADFPTFANPAPPADSDGDGMADAWERTAFGDLGQTANGDVDDDGYRNLEEYFHHLAGDAGTAVHPSPDAGVTPDTGVGEDSGQPLDAGTDVAVGSVLDAGVAADAGRLVSRDAGGAASSTPDAGAAGLAGSEPGSGLKGGSCSIHADPEAPLWGLLVACAWTFKRRRIRG